MTKSVRLWVVVLASVGGILALASDGFAGPFRKKAKNDCCEPVCCPTSPCATVAAPCCPTTSYAAQCCPAPAPRAFALRRSNINNCCPTSVVQASGCGTVGQVVVAAVPTQPMPLPAGGAHPAPVVVGPSPAPPVMVASAGTGCGADPCCDTGGRGRRLRIFRR